MILLNIGAGGSRIERPGYHTITLDVDPATRPDVVGDMCQLDRFPDASVHAVVARHCLEHVAYARGQVAMAEWHRVLVPGGILHVACPDVLSVVKACESLSDKVYDSPAGPIHVCDMLYGWRSRNGSPPAMRHWAAYDATMLERLLRDTGFDDIQMRAENYEIIGEARKCSATTI